MASESSETGLSSTPSEITPIDATDGQNIKSSLNSIESLRLTPQQTTRQRLDINYNNFDLPSGITNTPFDSFDPVNNILNSISRFSQMSISPQKSVSPDANVAAKSPLRHEFPEEVSNGPSDMQQFSAIEDMSAHTEPSSVTMSRNMDRHQMGSGTEIAGSPQVNSYMYQKEKPKSKLPPTSTHSTPGRRIINFDSIPQDERLKTTPRFLSREYDNSTQTTDTGIFATEETRPAGSNAMSSSPSEIPKLLTSIAPWGSSRKLKSSEVSSHPTIAPSTPHMLGAMDPGKVSSFSENSKRYSGTNDGFGLLNAVPTGSSSAEVQYLRKKLQAYQIRVNALNEIIKQANLGTKDVSNSNDNNSSCSGIDRRNNNNFRMNEDKEVRLQATHNDALKEMDRDQNEMINELRNTIVELNRKISIKDNKINELNGSVRSLESELKETKDEYVKTLNYADEYVKQSDTMAESIDRLLIYLTEVHFKSYQIPEQEVEILKKAKDIGSNFIAVKMNALETSLTNLLENLQEYERDIPLSLPNITVDGNVLANSTQLERTENELLSPDKINSKLEAAIEDIGVKCDKFVTKIRGKLAESSNIERLLRSKLLQQQRLIDKISQCNDDKLRSDDKDWSNLYKRSSVLSNFDDLNRKANLNLSKSYQEHIGSLNSLIETLKRNIHERDEELTRLKDLSRRDEASERKHRSLLMEINSLKEMSKFKEDNWNTLTYQLESQINDITSKNESLEKLIMELNNELKDVRESKKSLSDEFRLNKKDIESYLSQIQQLKSSNESLQNLILTLKTKQNSKLNVNELEFKKFNQNLLLHLTNTFQILKKIIQKSSIDQSMKKIQTITSMSSLANLKVVGPKFEVLYNFIEMALESIIESYTNLLLEQSESNTSVSANPASLDPDSRREMQFRIDELQKRWVAERERRKLDTDAAEAVISKLEMENKVLKDQLFNLSIRN